MTFCKEMSSRVEEPFVRKYIYMCFLGNDTNYCSDPYMFLIQLNNLIAVLATFQTTVLTAQCKTPFHGSFLGLQAPCHFVRHSPSSMAAILSLISFWIWWRHQLSSQRVLCRPGNFCKL